ncbi:hypothetical protein [Candidatus Liberibacter asiaticus]|uniref:hypothetical protein n=1 Tax=Liberibacter asiaticus TaxID=34021 RepID=UPI000A73C6AE|nr:hypothetical protein [Candidatus Liberibacter asiaticus]KAE9511342.1 hypothetical protein FXW31_02020 [Candidatus Liberibacter asiaticus]KAE9515211.1 hypothetical protein FXW26_04010 [Candidatus Liberibacter asiaticus]
MINTVPSEYDHKKQSLFVEYERCLYGCGDRHDITLGRNKESLPHLAVCPNFLYSEVRPLLVC